VDHTPLVARPELVARLILDAARRWPAQAASVTTKIIVDRLQIEFVTFPKQAEK
jgi:hypothetical protein